MKVFCIEESSSECLTVGNYYEMIAPFEPDSSGFIRIIDDLGDTALYPKNKFLPQENTESLVLQTTPEREVVTIR